MDLTTLGKAVTKFGAPLLGAVLGGPAGAAIGQLVANEFGGDIEDPTKLLYNINLDPQAKVKLAEIEANQKIELQRLLLQAETTRIQNEVAQAKIDAANTANARATNTKNQSIFPEILSVFIAFGFFGCIYWIAAYEQSAKDHEILNMLFGVLGTAFVQMLNYWMGTSSSKVNFNNK